MGGQATIGTFHLADESDLTQISDRPPADGSSSKESSATTWIRADRIACS
jgi:hypothetical protein